MRIALKIRNFLYAYNMRLELDSMIEEIAYSKPPPNRCSPDETLEQSDYLIQLVKADGVIMKEVIQFNIRVARFSKQATQAVEPFE